MGRGLAVSIFSDYEMAVFKGGRYYVFLWWFSARRVRLWFPADGGKKHSLGTIFEGENALIHGFCWSNAHSFSPCTLFVSGLIGKRVSDQ